MNLNVSFLPQRSIFEFLSNSCLQLKSGQQGLTIISQFFQLSSLRNVNLTFTAFLLPYDSMIINIYITMIKITICFFLLLLSGCQLVSRPIQTTYTEYGAFQSFVISFKPTQDICSTCFIQITFPEVIHLNPTPITFSLYDEDGVPYIESGSPLTPTSNIYYFGVNQILKSTIWYTIQIYPSQSPTMIYGLVGISIISGNTASNIIYMQDSAFEYYHLQSIALPSSNLAVTAVSTPNTQASTIYPFELTFASSVTLTQITILTFYFSNQNYSLLTPTTPLAQNNNFNFVGTCQIICLDVNCINPLSCIIQNNQIKLTLPYLSTITYKLQFTILNPSFVDITGIAGQIENENGLNYGIGIANNVFTVSPISILPADINLHWGIPLNIVQNTMGLGLFVDGGWNTIDIGFKISQLTMIGNQFKVKMYVGASSVLQQSINTNLPSLNGTSKMVCLYILPNIQCSPVDAFTSISLRYYIKFKAYIASTDNIANLGSIKISLTNSNNILFTDLTQAPTITKIPWANYRDPTGFHSSGYSIKETQVIGAVDSGLTNSTSTFMNSFYTSNATFVGIDPQIGVQQLVFLIKTSLAQMSNGLTNQTYQMKVYINRKIFSSIGTKGLDVTAYDASSNSYRGDAVSCYVNSSTSPTIQIYQCQAYDDYVYGTQIDNTFTVDDYYGVYSFICGNGQVVVCPTGQVCDQSCRIFKGKSNTNGYSGVFSIRNVQFIQGYQSNYLANQMGLDFIIAFYQGGNLVTASLINAYTIKKAKLSYLGLSFYNTYLSATKTNDGSRIPNLVSLQGHLSIDQINGLNYDQFVLFLPQQVTVNRYIESSSGRVGCTHECSSNLIFNSLTVCQDNWPFKQKVSIKGIINIDSSIDFKMPVEILTTISGSFQLALVKNSIIVKIYRINGSAIADSLLVTPTPIISTNSYVNPWVSPSYWVKNTLDTYKQGLNLNLISEFSSTNTIDMLGSTISYGVGTTYMTFTIIHTNIFSTYSSLLINNQALCNKPFQYRYGELYDVTVLLCPLQTNGINQVVINYPYYESLLGAGFPFKTVFAYAVSDSSGNLIAYRTQSNTKSAKEICTTSHLNNYNHVDIIQQQISLSLSINPIDLSPTQYSSFQVSFTAPPQIPINYLSCSVTQTLLKQSLTCSIISSALNIGTIQISSANSITVTVLQISLWATPAGASTVSPLSTYYYTVNVILPQTDNMGVAVFTGSVYSPFSSTVSQCSSFLNLVSVLATSQPITISSISSKAIALNYYADITFDVKFSSSRPNIISSSQIDIQFTNLLTTSLTTCTIWTPQNYIFIKQVILANSVQLKPNAYDTPFTYTSYTITCKNLIVTQNNIAIKVVWLDGANILQQSTNTPSTLNLINSNSVGGSLLSKTFNTLGYDSQYTISIALSTNLNDNIEVWIDLKDNSIHQMVLECYYLSNGLNKQIYCIKDWQGKVHLIFSSLASTNIIFSIYGIQQDKAVSSNYLVLTSVNKVTYYVSTITDSLTPNTISSQPIVIKSQSITSDLCLQLTLSFPFTYSSSFYIRVDDMFIMPIPAIFLCSVGGITQPCLRKAPNLIQIVSTFSFAGNIDALVQICQLLPSNIDVLDYQQIHFGVFTLSGGSINIGSHEHLGPLQSSTVTYLYNNLLIWSQVNFNTSWTYHQIHIGYYSNPIFLTTFNQDIFKQNLLLSSSSYNSLSYINQSNNILLGTTKTQIDIAYVGSSYVNSLDYWLVTHQSLLYTQPSILPLFISNKQCIVSAQYPLYDTYPGGITLPIILDFKKCRPAVDHFLTYSISTTQLIVDRSLTNQKVNSTFPQVYIFIRQIPTNTNLNGVFTLNIGFNGPFDNSFIVNQSINIRVNTGTIVQIPQSTMPTIQLLNNSMINMTLQCNQPSTIYWALGLYPTILGITSQMVQTQLINAQQGMRKRVFDPYSWSQQVYGLDYEYYANKNKTILIDTLKGDRKYIFKYFCVNQLGSSSGGQILYFDTNSTGYGLNKIQLQFSSPITINTANNIACSMAQTLLTPYSTVITSTFSNCINTSLIYFPTLNTTYYDEIQGNVYSYYFYVDSQTVPSNFIRENLPYLLLNNTNYLRSSLPYSAISITPLLNNYDPIVKNHYFDASIDKVSCIIDVGVTRSYLIVAYMQQTFDPMKMTLPPHYLIKQGLFSAVSKFNQVYMKYGSNNITINITGLKQAYNYSIFYFVTVDNPALNSKPTKVYYENVQTYQYIYYNLWSQYITLSVMILCLISIF